VTDVDSPLQPRDGEDPVFAEAWEAQAFAMALLLHERGVFTWKEWSATLADEIKAAETGGEADDTKYYHHWLNALERLVVEKGVASADRLHDVAHAWEDAARATPHGHPIALDRSHGDTRSAE
jgi:nitrile hydratase accessory protein